MHAFTTLCVLCLLVLNIEARMLSSDYIQQRNDLLEDESKHYIGGNLHLTDAEISVNNMLMKLKHNELDHGFNDPENFKITKHYFAYRELIEKSNTYQIIRNMPKGAALHVHGSYMLDADSLLQLTYEDHLYACYPNKDELIFRFSETVPTKPCDVKWKLFSELRANFDNNTTFDKYIKRHLSLYTRDVSRTAGINRIWSDFEKVHDTISSLIAYRPVREKYFYKCLENLYEDNVMYAELRGGLSSLYELNGTIHDKMYLPRMYRDITNKFIEDHPDFIGIKIILTTHRTASETKLRQYLELAKEMKAEFPDIFAGFDLVGQEDLGRPLAEFQSILTEYKNDVDYYFHAGETNWFGTTTDENLVDAVLLGSKRLGHAYALIKHPSLLKLVKQRSIPLEVNVISNHVLALVRDVRNHPLAAYMALGVPVVLSSDDPGAWGSKPLSHDFYIAFVGVASRTSDLKLLKQLAINSIKYSALDDKNKQKLFKVFYKRWNAFIDDVRNNRNVFEN